MRIGMYIFKSLLEGLKILGFDKETIKKTSKEKSLEEIFLSTIFLNYIIILVVYLIGIAIGNYSIQGRDINMNVLFGLLMIYPFAYNLVVYGVYGFFGLMAELLNKKNTIKPLISVGFHTAVVYAILIYVIALCSTFSLSFGAFTFSFFILYFLYTMFFSISEIYELSVEQTLIVLFIPILIISMVLLLIFIFIPNLSNFFINIIFK